MPYSVLFVCLGNFCRSPMAEAVFANMVKQRGLEAHFPKIDSAGTSEYHVGNKPDVRSVAECKAHGISITHLGQKVKKADFEEFNYILCMDESNLADLKELQPRDSKAIVKLFGEFDPQGERIIQDPYYGGIDGFEHNFQQVTRAAEGFLESLNLN